MMLGINEFGSTPARLKPYDILNEMVRLSRRVMLGEPHFWAPSRECQMWHSQFSIIFPRNMLS